MKIALSYDVNQIKQLIVDDIDRKIGVVIDPADVKIKVRSKQNYRENEFEFGELKCDLEAKI